MPESPNRCSWSAWIGPERDSDGQPDIIHVAPSDGAHVTEADAQWVRSLLSAAETLTELQQWLNVRAETCAQMALNFDLTARTSDAHQWYGRADEAKETLDWLETKRSGND